MRVHWSHKETSHGFLAHWTSFWHTVFAQGKNTHCQNFPAMFDTTRKSSRNKGVVFSVQGQKWPHLLSLEIPLKFTWELTLWPSYCKLSSVTTRQWHDPKESQSEMSKQVTDVYSNTTAMTLILTWTLTLIWLQQHWHERFYTFHSQTEDL